jgi:putative SOS response-associated peptidase YedK
VRSETVAEKTAYRNSFKQRRCIVPANGFFEWKRPAMRPFGFTHAKMNSFQAAASGARENQLKM